MTRPSWHAPSSLEAMSPFDLRLIAELDRSRGLAPWFEWSLAALGFLVLLGTFRLLLSTTSHHPWLQHIQQWPKALFAAHCLILCSTFGLAYHALFQGDPARFALNAIATDDGGIYRLIYEQHTLVKKYEEAGTILAFTTALLRNDDSKSRLDKFPSLYRGVYLGALRCGIVGPPLAFTIPEAAAIRAFEAGESRTAEEIVRTSERIASEHPGILADLGCSEMRDTNLPALVSARFVLERLSGLQVPPILDKYKAPEDSRRLEGYLAAQGISWKQDERVDLSMASDALARDHARAQAFVETATSTRARMVDFLYFSVVTVATVGYGDLVPSSTNVKGLVVLEILLGILTLVVAATTFLGRKGA